LRGALPDVDAGPEGNVVGGAGALSEVRSGLGEGFERGRVVAGDRFLMARGHEQALGNYGDPDGAGIWGTGRGSLAPRRTVLFLKNWDAAAFKHREGIGLPRSGMVREQGVEMRFWIWWARLFCQHLNVLAKVSRLVH